MAGGVEVCRNGGGEVSRTGGWAGGVEVRRTSGVEVSRTGGVEVGLGVVSGELSRTGGVEVSRTGGLVVSRCRWRAGASGAGVVLACAGAGVRALRRVVVHEHN